MYSLVAISKVGTTPSSSKLTIFGSIFSNGLFISSFFGVVCGTMWQDTQGDNPGRGVATCGTYLWQWNKYKGVVLTSWT